LRASKLDERLVQQDRSQTVARICLDLHDDAMGADASSLMGICLAFTRSPASILDPSEVREYSAKALFRCGQLVISAK
jgi:hypothetical protein